MHKFQWIGRFFVLGLFAFLASCAHVHHKDGPPDYYVDETKIPNAVPKVEPLSKYGNMTSYDVFGRRYYVLRSSKNYEEQGIASWYGTQFHTHHTSNGERYNMLAMTAAHKTLPLPTYVLVTNLKNKKQVIVKINDRGPFEANRLIDLSYVAAKKLGMLGHGTAMVDVKAIDPREYWQTQPSLFAKHKTTRPSYASNHLPQAHYTTYYIQAGVFHSRARAQAMRNRLQKVVSAPVRIAYARSLYHVQIGPFRDVATAGRLTRHLRAVGIKTTTV